MGDKEQAQRVVWLAKLLSMPRDAFPRLLAGELIGRQAAGYAGLDVLSADLGQLQLRPQAAGRSMAPGGFYWEAIKAWSMITPDVVGGPGQLGHDHVFCNHQITSEAGTPFDPIPWMVRKGIHKVGQVRGLSGIRLYRDQWFELVALRQRIPDLPISAEPRFVLSGPLGEKEVGRASFKEVYLTFRSKVDNYRHFEQKWEEALGVVMGQEEWREVWKRVHESHCSLKVRS